MSGTFFFPLEDLSLLATIKAELHYEAFMPVRIYYPDLETSNYDPLYGEALREAKQTDTFFDIPGWYKISPFRKEYGKFGIEDRRDIILVFSTEVLDQGYPITTVQEGVTVESLAVPQGRTPYPYPGFGCTFLVEGEFYVVTNAMRDDYFGNTGLNTSWVVLGNKARLSSMRERELADVFTTPTGDVPLPSTPPGTVNRGIVISAVPHNREPIISKRED